MKTSTKTRLFALIGVLSVMAAANVPMIDEQRNAFVLMSVTCTFLISLTI
jgi:hypothetical protein